MVYKLFTWTENVLHFYISIEYMLCYLNHLLQLERAIRKWKQMLSPPV